MQKSTDQDEDRLLTYARLVDPETWPLEGLPVVTPATRPRLLFSLQAAYRIAMHEGSIDEDKDPFEALAHKLDLHVVDHGIRFPEHLSAAEIADAMTVLTGQSLVPPGDGPSSEENEDETDEAAETDHLSEDERPHEDWPQDGDKDLPDPNHDPEMGISHVGDADAGQHIEEQ